MKTALIRGPILSKSGYGTHCRQVFKWLLSAGYDVQCNITPWGVTSWYVNPEDLNGLVGEAMRRTGRDPKRVDLTVQVQLPHEWEPNLGKFNVGVTAGVETTRAPEHWAECVRRMDLVIVPSEFSKSGLVAAGAPAEKITVVPESFSDNLLDATRDTLRHLQLDEVVTPFNFLMFGQVTSREPETDRKNLLYAVKWFCEEFRDNKQVGLIVKTNLGTSCVFHRMQLEQMFSALVKEVRTGDYPRVYLVNGDMSNEDCASLLLSPKVKAMVSFTRGEGFGLPLIDAAAAGLPVIATGWSGHTEFLGLGKYSKVSYSLAQVPHEKLGKEIFAEGSQWAMPHEEDAKKRMRKMYESQSVPREWAKDLREKVQRSHSFDSISKHYDRVIGRAE